VLFKVIIWW